MTNKLPDKTEKRVGVDPDGLEDMANVAYTIDQLFAEVRNDLLKKHREQEAARASSELKHGYD